MEETKVKKEVKTKKEKKEITVNFWAFTFLVGSMLILVFVLAWVWIANM